MSPPQNPDSAWGTSFRLIASEKWKAKSAAMGRDVTETLVAYANPKTGMHVLDIATGTGEPAISIAAQIAPEGHVTALDQSADLLKIAAERARQRGLTNFSTRQADAHHLPFSGASYDLVTSRFGVMFLREEALGEAHRVLKRGARACFLAWGPPEQPYWASTMGIAHKYAGGPLTHENQNPFKYSELGSLSAALRRAGFLEVEEETRTVSWTWPGTAEQVWEQSQAVAAPFLPMLDRVPRDKRDIVNQEALDSIRKYESDGSIKFGAVIVLASGKKSSS